MSDVLKMMQETIIPLDFPFKPGDKVQSKGNPDEQGEVYCISYIANFVRVYIDVPFSKVVRCYHVDELKLI